MPTESALEENSIGFILSESCLVARGALTRKKEQAKDKKRCEEVPKTRKAGSTCCMYSNNFKKSS